MDSSKFLNSKFIKGADVEGPAAVTVASTDVIKNTQTGDDQLAVTFSDFAEDKVLTLNVGNHKAIVKATGSYDTDKWVGAKLEIYTEAEPMAADGRGVRLRELTTTSTGGDFNDEVTF